MKVWIARDFDGTLRAFNEKPTRHNVERNFDTSDGGRNPNYRTTDGWWNKKGEGLTLHPNTFQSVQWFSEPKEVTLKLHY